MWCKCVVKRYFVEEGEWSLEKDNLCQRGGCNISESPQQQETGLTAQAIGRTRRLEWAAKKTLKTFPYWEHVSPTENPKQPYFGT